MNNQKSHSIGMVYGLVSLLLMLSACAGPAAGQPNDYDNCHGPTKRDCHPNSDSFRYTHADCNQYAHVYPFSHYHSNTH